jgi:plastocyanin
MRLQRILLPGCLAIASTLGCHSAGKTEAPAAAPSQPVVQYFRLDEAHAGSIKGTIKFAGKKPTPKMIDMSEDPACVEAHKGKAYDESLVVNGKGDVANAFVYIEKGLEGKNFETPTTPVVIDQRGCWFRPRVMGIQVGQALQVVNSDPVTHNIHPMAVVNREWNHSQGPGDEPISRKFTKTEVMVPVKCNIHSWMHSYIGVLDHPFYAVSGEDGTFTLPKLPPGTYTLAVWQEKLGTQRQQIEVAEGHESVASVTYKGQ